MILVRTNATGRAGAMPIERNLAEQLGYHQSFVGRSLRQRINSHPGSHTQLDSAGRKPHGTNTNARPREDSSPPDPFPQSRQCANWTVAW